MRLRFRADVAAALVLAAAGCSVWHAQPLPSPVSRETPGHGRFRAGVARVDITPPPGVGMGGSGPEGRRSTGYRTRLYAGAMVLEDATGERIALVVADLPHVSANLHRLAAARLVERTGIGADRLIVSATHTHSGPGHFYGERQYNASVSRVPGYDPRMTDYLVERITQAVELAADSLRPALIAWGDAGIVGATWNRSFQAFCRNPEARTSAICADSARPKLPKDSAGLAVDTTLFMLRVDELDSRTHDTIPLGSYAVFALHGTSIPSVNTLLDGDAHVRIVERLARHADSIEGRPTVHLLANGAEGDVAPEISRDQCDVPRLGLFDPVPLPRGPGETVDFIEPAPHRVKHCVEDALGDVDDVAAKVAGGAISLFDALKRRLRADVAIRRAYTTAWLPGHDGLCGAAEVGSATAAGGDGLETRVRGWRWLFWPLLKLGLEEGGSAVDRNDGQCQSPKRTLLGPIQASLIVGEHGFPEVAQLTVVRIDSVLLLAVPAEVTTIAGRRIRDSVAKAAAMHGAAPSHTALIGLANGFLQYVTTEEEYQWQAYEGGSNLYGPGTARFLERRLVELAERLPRPGIGPSPQAEVAPITAYPGPPKAIMPSATAGPDSIEIGIDLDCDAGRLVGHWRDLAPGRLFPRSSPWVALERETAPGQWERVAVDGDGRLEIHAVGARKKRGFEWRAVWLDAPIDRRYKLVRLGDSSSPGWVSNPRSCADDSARSAGQRP